MTHHQKRLILVLGMKRSGTSALAKGLETMGVSLGNHLKPPNDFNEKGFWEDLDFHAFNLEMLNSFKNRLRRIAALTEEETAALINSPFWNRASQLLLEKIAAVNGPLGLKAPSFSILLPFWKKVFEKNNISWSAVIALRNPISTALSAERCFSDPQEKSLWTWISYMLSSLVHSENSQRVLVDYDELIKNPAFQMQRVAIALGLETNASLLHEYTHHFIDPTLRHVVMEHQHFSNNDLSLKLALEMYEKLRAIAMDQESFYDLKKPLEQWMEKFSSVQGLLTLLEMHEYTIAKLVGLTMQLQQTSTGR